MIWPLSVLSAKWRPTWREWKWRAFCDSSADISQPSATVRDLSRPASLSAPRCSQSGPTEFPAICDSHRQNLSTGNEWILIIHNNFDLVQTAQKGAYISAKLLTNFVQNWRLYYAAAANIVDLPSSRINVSVRQYKEEIRGEKVSKKNWRIVEQ